MTLVERLRLKAVEQGKLRIAAMLTEAADALDAAEQEITRQREEVDLLAAQLAQAMKVLRQIEWDWDGEPEDMADAKRLITAYRALSTPAGEDDNG